MAILGRQLEQVRVQKLPVLLLDLLQPAPPRRAASVRHELACRDVAEQLEFLLRHEQVVFGPVHVGLAGFDVEGVLRFRLPPEAEVVVELGRVVVQWCGHRGAHDIAA